MLSMKSNVQLIQRQGEVDTEEKAVDLTVRIAKVVLGILCRPYRSENYK